jgi:cephalosporin hydroxylase
MSSGFDFKAKEVALLAVNGFQAMQKVGELESLLVELLKSRPRVIVEIGAGRGGTSWAWSKLASVNLMVTIDLPDGPWGGENKPETFRYIADNTYATHHYLAGNSRSEEVRARLLEILKGREIDFLFIDGDHSYEGVKSDYEMYSPLVGSGGLVGFHDICVHPPELHCHVHEFWQELIKDNPAEKGEFLEEPSNWAGIGWLRVA